MWFFLGKGQFAITQMLKNIPTTQFLLSLCLVQITQNFCLLLAVQVIKDKYANMCSKIFLSQYICE